MTHKSVKWLLGFEWFVQDFRQEFLCVIPEPICAWLNERVKQTAILGILISEPQPNNISSKLTKCILAEIFLVMFVWVCLLGNIDLQHVKFFMTFVSHLYPVGVRCYSWSPECCVFFCIQQSKSFACHYDFFFFETHRADRNKCAECLFWHSPDYWSSVVFPRWNESKICFDEQRQVLQITRKCVFSCSSLQKGPK